MAGIIYSGGMSVVHVAMLCGMLFVRKPDMKKAKKFDKEEGSIYFKCEDFAQKIANTYSICMFSHIFSTISCFAKEIYETKLGLFG